MNWHHAMKFEGDEAAQTSEVSMGAETFSPYTSFYPHQCDAISNGGRCTPDQGDQVIVGGYSELMAALSRDLEHVTLFNTSVVGLRTFPADLDKKVYIETSSGTLLADKLILTLPLGVLKSGEVQFRPALSRRKRRAIRDIGFGSITKVGRVPLCVRLRPCAAHTRDASRVTARRARCSTEHARRCGDRSRALPRRPPRSPRSRGWAGERLATGGGS